MKIDNESKKKIKLGLSLMPTEDCQLATQQLFDQEKVQVVEWSFDFSFSNPEEKPWYVDLIDKFSDANSLLGHGVSLSPLSACFSERQAKWLESAKAEFKNRKYVHASEHFGFSEAGPIAHGPPLPVLMTSESLHSGKEMIKRYADATQCPVGLENLAIAFNLEDVKGQGEIIDQLISDVDGFLLLDLHNIYCQTANFRIPAIDILRSYPLSKVRELHISGGSWSHSVSGKRALVRRDTHDEAVPQEVFNLVMVALKLCPNIEFVVLERLGNTMVDLESQAEFREDFETLQEMLDLHV